MVDVRRSEEKLGMSEEQMFWEKCLVTDEKAKSRLVARERVQTTMLCPV